VFLLDLTISASISNPTSVFKSITLSIKIPSRKIINIRQLGALMSSISPQKLSGELQHASKHIRQYESSPIHLLRQLNPNQQALPNSFLPKAEARKFALESFDMRVAGASYKGVESVVLAAKGGKAWATVEGGEEES
jgi:hypothetical protein